MVGVGRDLCGSFSPTLLLKQGHLQQANAYNEPRKANVGCLSFWVRGANHPGGVQANLETPGRSAGGIPARPALGHRPHRRASTYLLAVNRVQADLALQLLEPAPLALTPEAEGSTSKPQQSSRGYLV